MKLEDVLLTKDQRKNLCTGCYPCDLELREQCLKLLDVLEKENLIHCDYVLQGDNLDGLSLTQVHSPNCRVCELEKLLKEG